MRIAEWDAKGLVAYIGATVIDATGRAPIEQGVVLVDGSRITAVGTGRQVPVPSEATVVDLTGKFLLPGLMDGNVHLVPWPSWTYIEFLARYEDRFADIAVEAAQIALSRGFTTVFDSMGPLDALLDARERIYSGATVGARTFVAGNIVGFRAVFHMPASMASASTAFQKRINDRFEAGGGPELAWLSPSQLYERMSRYGASGVDFIKYGATGDGEPVNSEVGQAAVLRFSPEQQSSIVRAGHDAGLPVQTHTTSAESLHISVDLGCDAGQHAAMTGPSRMYERTIELMLDSGYVCGTQWGPLSAEQLSTVRDGSHAMSEDLNGVQGVDFTLDNALRLVAAGVPQMVSTDAGTIDPDVASDAHQWGGLGGGASLIGEAEFINMAAMAERGMSAMQIVQAATINVAKAYGVDAVLGTLQAGKIADMVVLERDPLADVENLRSVRDVVQGGRQVRPVVDRVLTAAPACDPGDVRRA